MRANIEYPPILVVRSRDRETNVTGIDASTFASMNCGFAPAEITVQLDRIVNSAQFASSPKLQELLTYIVTEALQGRAERLKGVSIAQDVFGQTDPELAQTSTIVSVEARRLRRNLTDYYHNDGAGDPVIIQVPKGGFVPSFQATTFEPNVADQGHTSFAKRSIMPAIIGLIAVGFLTIALVWHLNRTSLTTTKLLRPAIAIVPFRNATGSAQNDRFVAGLTEDITTDLARLDDIDVISYSSVSLLTDAEMSPAEIGDILHVTHIVQGSLRGEVPNIRISAELLDAQSGKLIWASRFDYDLGAPLAMQDAIAAKVIDGLSAGLSDWKYPEKALILTVDLEAAALFEQAMNLANPPSNAARLKIAKLAFEAVIEADPTFAGGYAGVAYIGAFEALWGHSNDPEAMARISAASAERALDMDPESALAYDALALSQLIMRNFDGAIQNSKRAIEVAPNDPYAQSYHAFILTANGQAQSAIDFGERAIRLDPLTRRTPYRNILALIHVHAGNYQDAIDLLTESQRFGGPQTAGHIANKAAAYAGLEDFEEARNLVKTLPDGFLENQFFDWQKRSFRQDKDMLTISDLLQTIP